MTLRHTGGCFLFHLELLQLCCHCLWLTPSFKLAFKPFGPSYLLMPQHDWLLPQSLKPWEEILKIILMFRVGIKAYILSFYLQEGWVLSNHGCSLWAFISNIWSPKHFLQHCWRLTYKVALLFWKSIQPLARLIYFPQMFCRNWKDLLLCLVLFLSEPRISEPI